MISDVEQAHVGGANKVAGTTHVFCLAVPVTLLNKCVQCSLFPAPGAECGMSSLCNRTD